MAGLMRLARLAGAVWIMSDIKSEAVVESGHYSACRKVASDYTRITVGLTVEM